MLKKKSLRFGSLGPSSFNQYSRSHSGAIDLNLLRWEMSYLNFSEAKNVLTSVPYTWHLLHAG